MHRPAAPTKNDSQSEDESTCCQGTDPPHICYIAKDNEDAAAYHHVQSPEQANHQQKKVPNLQLVQCVKQESASHGTVPCRFLG